MKVSVILPAAGLGTRMGREKSGTSRKQFMLLEGAPILVHTTRKFAHCPSVTEIVVALRGEDLEWARGLIQQQHLPKPVRFVEGGDSRQQSVENALASLAPDTDFGGGARCGAAVHRFRAGGKSDCGSRPIPARRSSASCRSIP